MIDILRTCDRLDVEIFTVPRLFEVHASARTAETVRGMPLVRLRRPTFRSLDAGGSSGSMDVRRCPRSP